MDRIRIASLVALIWLALSSTVYAVTGQGVWIAFPNGTTCPNYNTAPINDQTLCYDSVTGWQVFHGSAWVQPNLTGVLCSQLPALTGDITTSAGSCATTSTAGKTPGGRLTLTSATPVMTADATAQGTVFYDTYITNTVPVANVNLAITSNEISVVLDATNDLSGSLYDIFAINSSGSLKLCTGPAWTNSTTRSQAIVLSNGVWTNSGSMTNCFNNAVNQGPIANGAGTYLGTFKATANGQTGMQFQPAAAAGGSNSILGLYNAYNRISYASTSRDNTASWTYASTTWRKADNNSNNSINFVDGLGQSPVSATYGVLNNNGGTVSAANGIDFNSTTNTPNFNAQTNSVNGATNVVTSDFPPALGLNFVQAMEACSSATTVTWYGSNFNVNQWLTARVAM